MKIRKLNTLGMSHILIPLVIIIGIAVIGTFMLVDSHAATAAGTITGVGSKCVDNQSSKKVNYNKVQIYNCNGTGAQKWTVNASSAASGTIVNSNGYCLDVYHSGLVAGTVVDLFKCNSTAAQLWTVNTSTGAIINPHSNLCLSTKSNGTASGTQLVLNTCNKSASEVWTVNVAKGTGPVGSGSPAPAPPKGSGSGSSGAGSGSSATKTLNCAPAKANTMTNTVSSKCGFPDTTNSGPSGTLASVGSGPTANTGSGWSVSGNTITVKANGVLENVNTGGKVVAIDGANATVKNVKIVSSSAQGVPGIDLNSANNALIENTEIGGGGTSSTRMLVGIKDTETTTAFSANTVIKANNIYYVSTGVQVDHGTVEDNYIHDLENAGTDHLNGTTSNGGGDDALLTLQHNTVFNPETQTDAISLFEDFAVQQNRVINDNLVAGGGYCIYGGQNSGGATVKNIRITNNHFSTMYYAIGQDGSSGCGAYGYIAAEPGTGNGNVWSGNVWDNSGATVSP